jgi:GH15 family glucan-1,4-alpha-glucosidase
MPSSIENYALIGDCETAALVARDGSIDWLCLPRFDSPACFAALLGSPENGRWQLKPRGKVSVVRKYRPHTLILETQFESAHGKVTLIDFMPLRETTPRIIRIVRGDSGTVQMEMDLVIRFDYGLTVPWVTKDGEGSLLAVAGPHRVILRSPVPVRGEQMRSVSEFSIRAGHTLSFELEYGYSFGRINSRRPPRFWLKKTAMAWQKWSSRSKYKGPCCDDVERSLITLKALTFVPTGAMVAAATTSLPERRGGPFNWDYRYCWLRDATFTLLGFMHAGYLHEAQRWKNWLAHAAAGDPNQLQIMYGVAGEKLLREWEVPWLAGYKRSVPVRVGNAASEQLQLDVYGELADTLHQSRLLKRKNIAHLDLQVALLEHLCTMWQEPDHGIWEIRGEGRHYTHSKVMAWVAFDRTIRDAERFKVKVPLEKWKKVRDEIHDNVCRYGFNEKVHSFVQSYGSREVDASLLLLPLVGFLPPLDPRIVATVGRIEKELMPGGLVKRYRCAKHGRLAPMGEGAFLPCSFWLVDYYALAGNFVAAERLLKRLLKLQNDVGLLAEEYDAGNRQFAGNFPQALTHVALVNTIINLHSLHGPARQRANRDQRQNSWRSSGRGSADK